MRELLELPSQRKVKILDFLFIQEDWISRGDLSAKTGISERTLSQDLKLLQKRWGLFLDLEVSPVRGIRLHNHSIASISRVFVDLFRESVALQWLEQIFFYPGNKIEFYSEKIYSSRSTLSRLLPKINRFLAGRGMKVARRNNQYEIVAEDEQYLRQFFAGFFLELYGADLGKLPIHCDIAVLSTIVPSLIEHAASSAKMPSSQNDDIAVIYFMMFYTTSLVREDQGYAVASDRPVDGEVSPENLVFLKWAFPHIKKKNLCPIHQFIVSQYKGWDSDEEKALVEREASACLNRIFQDMEIDPDPIKFEDLCSILKALYLNAKLRTFSTSILFDRIYYFSLTFKRNNLPVYLLLQKNLNQFYKRIQFDLTARQPDIIFWLCLAYPEISRFMPKKTVLVISDFGIQHAEFLAEFISSFFNQVRPGAVKISAARQQDLGKTALPEQYDLLISTVPALPVSHPHVFLIDDYPTKENLFQIYQAIL